MRILYLLAILVIGLLVLPDQVHSDTSSLVITEIMKNPDAVSDTNGEWFEVYNNSATEYSLAGLVIKDDNTDYHQISELSSLTIGAYSYFLFCRNGDSQVNGGVSCGYQYSSFLLGNNTDEVILLKDEVELDKVAYEDGAFPDEDGKALVLTDLGDDNENGENWHSGHKVYGSGDYGTPGSANSILPSATPTVTPTPTETPVPTSTPEPTDEPTPTNEPTTTKAPTSTPKPTPTKKATQQKTNSKTSQQSSAKTDEFKVGEKNPSYPLPDSIAQKQELDEEGILKNALRGLGGSMSGVKSFNTYEGEDGVVLATDSADAEGSVSPAPFIALGAMALSAMVGSAIYIQRKQLLGGEGEEASED